MPTVFEQFFNQRFGEFLNILRIYTNNQTVPRKEEKKDGYFYPSDFIR